MNRENQEWSCDVSGCTRVQYSKYYCRPHFKEKKTSGNLKTVSIFDRRPAIFKDGVAYIPIGVNAKHGYAIVDEDFAYLDRFNWTLSGGYAVTNQYDKIIFMHHMIIGRVNGKDTDHINRNRLDNRFENLRIVDRSTNLFNKCLSERNKSGYRNVHYNKRAKLWVAEVTINGKHNHLGYYKEAIDAYKKAQDFRKSRGIYEQ